jgi:3-deoxy-D-manno-octulosonic-acid transferase
MNKFVRFCFFLLYNLIFIPLLFTFAHIGALFNQKIRKGITGRYQNYKWLKKFNISFKDKKVVVVHCASMGEFEHIKPLLVELKMEQPQLKIVVLFFSPSGFQNVKSFKGVDLFLYTPFDWFLPVFRLFLSLKPNVWLITKHDIWPNQVWISNILNIPIFLINASFPKKRKKKNGLVNVYNNILFSGFEKILTVSEADKRYIDSLVKKECAIVAGDTKFDQVIFRRDESLKKRIFSPEIIADKWILVAGSTWPEDHHHLIPAIINLHEKYDTLFTIICPHEPTSQHINQLWQPLTLYQPLLLSNIHHYSNEKIIIVDKIGVLANLYSYGKVAYVGGSFRQNIHNVLEPAVYKIPVIMGPVNLNSREAQLLKTNGAGYEVKNASEVYDIIQRFLLNDIFRQEAGKKAYKIVEVNGGAARLTAKTILEYL